MQTVLLIEDDPNHIELAKRAMKNQKDEFNLHICQFVQKAMIWLKENQPDIILVDLNLPDGTALELIDKTKNDVFCPWIVITSQGNEKLAVEVMKSGAEDYIVKSPEMFREMPHLITKTLQSWQLKLAHQQTEIDLKKREVLLKTILATAQDGYWLVDHAGFFLEVNQAYCEMIGYDQNELIGQHIQFVEAEEDKAYITNKINRLIQTGKDRFETKHRRKDGTLIDVEVSTTYINMDQGYFVCFLRDLTEKNKAEQDLLVSERSYRQLVDTAYEGIWVFDQTYHLTFVNQRMADLLGYTADEMIGKSIDEFISPNEFEDLEQKKEQQKLGVPAQFERILICKDGSELVTLISASPLLNETGSFQGTFGMVTDISELKKIQHSLTISEKRFRRTFDFSPVGKALVDMDFKFVRCNQTFCEFLGYEENELLSKSYKDITYEEDIHIGKEELQKLIRDEIDIITLQKRYKHKNGEELWGETSIRLVDGEDGKTKYFLPVIQNIHHRKLADEKIKEREAKLESIFRASPIGMGIVVDRVFVEVNDQMCTMTGYTREELIGKNSIRVYPNEKSYDYVGTEKYRQITEKGTGTVETVWRHKNGHLINVLLSSTPLDQLDWKKGVTFTALDITERTMFVRFLAESEARFREVVNVSPNSIMVLQFGKYVYANPFVLNLLGYQEEEMIGMDAMSVIHPDHHQEVLARLRQIDESKNNAAMILKVLHKNGRWMYVESVSVPIEYNNQPAVLIVSHDINERIRHEEITKSRLHLLEYASDYSLRGLLQETLEEVSRLTESAAGFYHFIDEDQQSIRLQVWSKQTVKEYCTVDVENFHYPVDQAGVWVDCLRSRSAVIHNDYAALPHKKGLPAGHVPINREVVVPVIRGEKVVAILGVGNKKSNYTQNDVEIITELADLAWDITERKRVEEENYRQLEQLKLLHDVNLAISLHSGMDDILQEILNRIGLLDQVDGVLLVNVKADNEVDTIHQTGLDPRLTAAVHQNWLTRYKRLLKKAEPIQIIDIKMINPSLYTGVGEVMKNYETAAILFLSPHDEQASSLVLFSKTRAWLDQDWHDFLHSLAIQTSVAIENIHILQDLNDKNIELAGAYEAIIQGWSRALELRDKETQGHSRRVTQLSLKLARLCEYPEEKMEDFRRGVLLHDIGKMGIPDSILLKPGPLSDDEWVIMRQHPLYGYQLLKEIPDFQASLDIPYFHHERWDGSGYPQGLKGETIPLGARIFAVVDVWDALLDDRPYRPAWTKTSALAYLQKQSGLQFDPEVAQTFINLLQKEEKSS